MIKFERRPKELVFWKKGANASIEMCFDLKKQAKPWRDIDLNPITEWQSLAISGAIWTVDGKSSVGQCQDTIAEMFPESARVQRIIELWNRWHLNDMKGGTRTQQRVLDAKGSPLPYPQTHTVLEEAGCLVDRGYRYGSAWLVEPLPAEVIKELKELLEQK